MKQKRKPEKNAKTIPQKIARKELIGGGSAEVRSSLAKAQARRDLISGGGGGGGASFSSDIVSAGVLPRNLKVGAVTRAREQKVKVDKRTRQGLQQKEGVDVKKDKDVKRLGKVQTSKDRDEKLSKLKKGDKVKFKYYGKVYDGVVAITPTTKTAGRFKNIEIRAEGLPTPTKLINGKNIL